MPPGGIGDVEIGLMGWQSDAAGNRRADVLFPITNEFAPAAVAPVVELPPAEAPAADSSGRSVVVLGAGFAALAAAALAVALRRRQGALQRGA